MTSGQGIAVAQLFDDETEPPRIPRRLVSLSPAIVDVTDSHFD